MSHATFAASYDGAAKGITIVVAVILLSAGIVTGSIGIGAASAAILFLAWAWSPTSYSIEGGFLVVHRFFGNVQIPIASIREVAIATPVDLSDTTRVFGSGGAFGYYGKFRTAKLGATTWYMTNQANAVIVTSDFGRMLFSPDDVDGFLAWLSPPGQRPPSGFTPSPIETKERNYGAMVAIGIIVLTTALALGAMFYSPGLPSYTLTNDKLTIQDKFYPVTLNASAIDMKSARVIDFNTDPDWKPVTRSNGFGNAHYHSGFFKLSDGREVRMYRADSTRLILLPPKTEGDPVLFETKEPQKFLSEIQQKWGNGS
jgi:hypothetical protein